MSLGKEVFLAFIPLFVAVDAIGVLPLFVSLTQGIKQDKRSKIVLQSVMTAMCLAIVFIFIGRTVFKLLNITMYDFMVAGGVILFCIGIMDIITPGKRRRIPSKEVGAVPIGTPLIVGPAVLTTSLVILEEYGMVATLIAVLANIIIAGIVFSLAKLFTRILGESGSKALSKVMSLLLAAIAVMMVRKGILFMISMY
ncbi:MAG: MarC family protein [Candidatus Omnitrophota bacterium]|nr:MarC family protein [Candidatus Omnitrophota bacterium]